MSNNLIKSYVQSELKANNDDMTKSMDCLYALDLSLAASVILDYFLLLQFDIFVSQIIYYQWQTIAVYIERQSIHLQGKIHILAL